jgi:CheY-like chemotaxis protein
VNKDASHRTVLIVDDEPTVCTTLSLLLKRLGFVPFSANSGSDALSKFSQQSFDLVITDFSMPEMSGLELAVAMKTKVPRQPIIMLTAFVEKFRFQPPLPGIDKLMGKPISVADLKDAVETVLEGTNAEVTTG